MGPLSRRSFLKIFGATLGVSAVALSGLGYFVTRTPSRQTSEVQTPKYKYGVESAMNRHVLVAYATRTGSTVGVAAVVGETLSTNGVRVDVKPIKENPPISGYDAVVIGSAVNGAHWLPEALEYVANNRQTLSQIPVALFCVHIMNLGEDAKSKSNRLAYLDDVRKLVKPVNEAYFAGMGMNPDEQSWLVRWAYRTFKIGPEGDCRDWAKIRGWADVELRNTLSV